MTIYPKLTAKEEYDLHSKKPNEGSCEVCQQPTKFYSRDRGYQRFCGRSCSGKANAIKVWNDDVDNIKRDKHRSRMVANCSGKRKGIKNKNPTKDESRQNYSKARLKFIEEVGFTEEHRKKMSESAINRIEREGLRLNGDGNRMNTLKGIFKPLNPDKYRGDANNIVYRSSWEMRCMARFDTDSRIVWWSSEEMSIQYYNPVKKRPARYFPDFIIAIKNPDGSTKTLMIEVKPHQETLPPTKPLTTKDKRKIRRFIYESATFSVNQAKWAAARKFCSEKGIGFAIFTEYEIGIKKRTHSNK